MSSSRYSVSESEGTKGINTEDLKDHSAAQPQPQTIKKKPRMNTNRTDRFVSIGVHSWLENSSPNCAKLNLRSSKRLSIAPAKDGPKTGKARTLRVLSTSGDAAQRIFSIRNGLSSEIAIRCCFIESRSRTVTVSTFSGSFSPIVSKSTVTPNGVPASS